MTSHQLHSSVLNRCFLSTVSVVFSISLLHAQSATAPTASEDPASIDQIWQKATSKYDVQRATILKDVDSTNHEGPFRPDWESLQKYVLVSRHGRAEIHGGGFSFYYERRCSVCDRICALVYSSPKNAGRLERPAGVLQRAVYATDLGFGFVLAFGCLLCFAVNSAATAFSTLSTSTR